MQNLCRAAHVLSWSLAGQSRHYASAAAQGSGLFGIQHLQTPGDFLRWSMEAKERSQVLIQQVMAAPADASVVQLMDDLSDQMCQVYDSAECCRSVHTDPAWRAAAQQACQYLGAFIAEVNHHEGMYWKLRATMDRYHSSRQASTSGQAASNAPDAMHHNQHQQHQQHQQQTQHQQRQHQAADGLKQQPRHIQHELLSNAELAAFDAETVMVGRKLQQDFEKSGVLLQGAAERARMQELMNLNNHYPAQYNMALSDPQELGVAEVSASLVPPAWRFGASRRGQVAVPLDSGSLHHFLSHVPNEEARKQVYVAGNSTPACNIALLDDIIAARHEMAALLGFPSYAHFKAHDSSLAMTPDAVAGFLSNLAQQVRPLADAEVSSLAAMKKKQAGDAGATLQAWDVDYYTMQARASAATVPRSASAPYLHLHVVLRGLSELLGRVMGLRLVHEQLDAGEGWAPGVMRMAVEHEALGRLGVLYLDLEHRPNKLPGSVLFPVRCGRQLPGGRYQQPLLVLVSSCGNGGSKPILSWRELRTLVHELGHAVHNMVSRTRYQHLWGTRCPQDIVEIPSHLFEHFLTDHRSASMIARHASSNEPLPAQLHAKLAAEQSTACPALELQQQTLLALVDQAYFGMDRPGRGETSQVWAALMQKHGSVPYVQGTAMQARFSHLTIYGACYYSYLYARCLSAELWHTHLAPDPLDREAGDKLRQLLLEPGGALEPYDLVQGALGANSSALVQLNGGLCPRAERLVADLRPRAN